MLLPRRCSETTQSGNWRLAYAVGCLNVTSGRGEPVASGASRVANLGADEKCAEKRELAASVGPLRSTGRWGRAVQPQSSLGLLACMSCISSKAQWVAGRRRGLAPLADPANPADPPTPPIARAVHTSAASLGLALAVLAAELSAAQLPGSVIACRSERRC